MTPLLLGLAVAVAAPGPKDPPKADGPLVGTWALESMTAGGTPRPGLKATVTFAQDGTYVTRAEATPPLAVQSQAGTYRADPKRAPAEVDITSAAGGVGPARTSVGIYRVDGDTLTVCSTVDGARPKGFDAPAGSNRTLAVYRRVRKD
jgi:uncharacterized protein (TIGR03067 family)